MAALTRAAWGQLKRLARYLRRFPWLSWMLKREEAKSDTVDEFSDSDWAGCVHVRVASSPLGGSAIEALELDTGDGGLLEWRGGVCSFEGC